MKVVSKVKDDFSTRLKISLASSFKKLVQAKKQTNGILIFSENGKIVKVKADKIKL